jgi:hypothetical protein
MVLAVGTGLLSGCANGDFQEVRPSLVRDDIHDWVAYDAIAGQATLPSIFELTDDERLLRDLAYPLIEPPYDRHRWYSVVGEYGLIGVPHGVAFNRAVYAEHLMGARYRSPSARYAQLSDDIKNDAVRLPQFYETATRVLDIDRKRRKSLRFIPDLSPAERKNAIRRMNENESIVSLVNLRLAQRVSSYRFALERLVVATPSPSVVQVERALNQLEANVAYYRAHRVPTGSETASLGG